MCRAHSGKLIKIWFCVLVAGWICSPKTINLAAICTPVDYKTRPLNTIYNNFIYAFPVYCSKNRKRLIHFSACEVYDKIIGSFLHNDHSLRKEGANILKGMVLQNYCGVFPANQLSRGKNISIYSSSPTLHRTRVYRNALRRREEKLTQLLCRC